MQRKVQFGVTSKSGHPVASRTPFQKRQAQAKTFSQLQTKAVKGGK